MGEADPVGRGVARVRQADLAVGQHPLERRVHCIASVGFSAVEVFTDPTEVAGFDQVRDSRAGVARW